jgi:hypothetical protein
LANEAEEGRLRQILRERRVFNLEPVILVYFNVMFPQRQLGTVPCKPLGSREQHKYRFAGIKKFFEKLKKLLTF